MKLGEMCYSGGSVIIMVGGFEMEIGLFYKWKKKTFCYWERNWMSQERK